MGRWNRLGGAAAFACFILLGAVCLPAQEYFGKNKVNYGEYDWRFIETEHFTIYFDKESLPVAEFTAKEAERSLVQIEKDLKYTLKDRYPIVVYNSHSGFAVSNISPYEQSEFTGGYTEFAQQRVVIPYTGSYADFRHVIHHELAHVVAVELWTGGGWLGAMISQPTVIPPLWVIEGLAEYSSQFGWDLWADNFMRDATITGYVPPIDQLNGYFAYKGGQSVLYMMDQTYGKDKVAQFIRDFRSAKSVDKSLKSSIGIGAEAFNDKWHLWLKRQYWNEINLHENPDEMAKPLTEHREEGSIYNVAPAISPQGDKVAYLTDRDGAFDIRLRSAIDGKDLGRLVAGEKSSDFESMFVLRPGITWSPDGRQIAFAAKSNNKNTLYILDVKKKKVIKRFKFDLDGLYEPTWSPDGNHIAVAGLKDGWSDIHIVDLRDESLHRITNDPYDEQHLDWSPDGKWLAISSDRPDTNMVFDGKKDFVFGQYDIFVVRADGSEIRRVVAHEATELHPVWGPDSRTLAFVSDRTGVGNVYMAHLDSSGIYPVTNLLSSAQYIDWSADGKKIAFTTFHKAGLDIFVLKDPLARRKDAKDLPLTRSAKRLRGIDEKTIVEMQQANEKDSLDSASVKTGITLAPADTAGSDNRRIERWISDQMTLAAEEEKAEPADADSVLTDSSEVERKGPSMKDWEKEFTVHKYKIKFKPEFFAANAGFDTFYGFSGLAEFSLSDVMGDHRVILVTSLNFSLEDSDFFLSYWYLKRQTNYAAQLFHTRLFFFDGGILNSDRYYGAAVALDRPFNRFSRFELGARAITIARDRIDNYYNPYVRGGFFGGTGRGYETIRLRTDRAVITEAALVDDTTMYGYYGPISGRRARLSVEGSKAGMEFVTVQGDYRTYARILKEYTFALRLAGGTGFGKNRTRFFVGGVNNPINPTFSTIASVSSDELFFSSFVWPLRGVELFGQAGDSFVLANASFRFPLFRTLALGWPLPFFFQNVQGELFMDVGGAFDRGNFDPWDARDGGFQLVDLKGGYGLGVQVNLGIFLFRYDLAWPTDFAQTFHPKQYFSLDYTGHF